jgi:hypothetical protein
LVTIYYKRCSSSEEALERFEHVFNYQSDLYDMLHNRRPFLSRLASLLKEFNYEVTVLPSEYMEELLSGHFSLFILKLIQRQAGKSVSELSAGELLESLEEINQSAHLYKKMEKKDYRIVFFHSYDNPESIRKLGNVLSEILRQAYLSLSMEIAENMLVFRIYPTQTDNPRILIVDEKLAENMERWQQWMGELPFSGVIQFRVLESFSRGSWYMMNSTGSPTIR